MSKPDKRAIKRLVDAALRHKENEKNEKKAFEACRAKLAELGVHYHDEWTPTKGGGNSWIAQGTGIVGRITYPADRLKEAINAASKEFIKVRNAAGNAFDHLFEAANFFKPVAKFREKAVQLLGKEKGAKLIRLFESDNDPKLSFEAGEKADLEDAV